MPPNAVRTSCPAICSSAPRLVAESRLSSTTSTFTRSPRIDVVAGLAPPSPAASFDKPSGSQIFFDMAGSTDKTLKLYEGHYHDLLNDLGREEVLADVVQWIDARVG